MGQISDGSRAFVYGSNTKNLEILRAGCPVSMGEVVSCKVRLIAQGEEVAEIISASLANTKSAVAADDVLVQIMNFLFTGDLQHTSLPTPRAEREGFDQISKDVSIIDRANCIVQIEDSNFISHTRSTYYFNNVYLKSVSIRADRAGVRVSGDGAPFIADVSAYGEPRMTTTPIRQLKTNALSISIDGATVERAKKALDLLYSQYCKGKASAF